MMVAPFWAACDPRHATIIYHSMPQAVEGYFFWMHNVRFGCTFHFFFQFSATEWTVTTRALAVSNSLASIHMLILVHQQECMVGHCNAWTVSYWYICMSLTTSPHKVTYVAKPLSLESLPHQRAMTDEWQSKLDTVVAERDQGHKCTLICCAMWGY